MSLRLAYDGLGIDPQEVAAIHSKTQVDEFCTVNVYLKSGAVIAVYQGLGPDDADEIVSGMTNDFRDSAKAQQASR